MNKKIKVSIVVPVYNVEQYLDRCLNTIVCQTYDNIEVILVDDGSTDKSSEICDDWSLKDKRIKTIHKNNGGLSDARNYGLNEATGDYVYFVDSDDYIPENAISNMVQFSDIHPEIIVGNYILIEEGKPTCHNHKVLEVNKQYTGEEYLGRVIEANEYEIPVWANMYDKDFLLNNNLLFEKGLLHEDERWTPFVFLKASRIIYTNTANYYYDIRSNSISQKKDYSQNIEHLMTTLKRNSIEFENIIINSKLLSLLQKDLVDKYLFYSYRFKMTSQQREMFIDMNFLKRNTNTMLNKFKFFLFKYCYPGLCLYYKLINKLC